MDTALLVFAVLLAVAVLLLAVPVDVAFRLRGVAPFRGQITIRWLFRLVRVRIRLPRERRPRAHPEAARAAHRAGAHASKRSARSRVAALLRQPAFRRRSYRALRELLQAVDVRRLHLRVRLGLGDPADTGRLWALAGPLNAAAQNLRTMRLRLEPDFADAVFAFRACGRVLLTPLRFVTLAVAFALSPASLRAWRTVMIHDG